MFKKLASDLLSGLKDVAAEQVKGLDLVKGAGSLVAGKLSSLKSMVSDDDDDDDEEEEEEEQLDVHKYSSTLDNIYDGDKGMFALRRKSDKEYISDWYDEIDYMNEACGRILRNEEGDYGILNNETGQVAEKYFQDIRAFGDRLVVVLNEKDHYALYDAEGHKVFGWMNDIGKLKKNGYSLVENKKEEYAVIDSNGSLVCEWGDRASAQKFIDSK